nr:PAS domain-containing protein [Melioribacteraceae bacterium]
MKSFFKSNKNIFQSDTSDSNNFNWIKDFVDYTSSPIIRADVDGTFLYINQSFAKMLAYLSKSNLQEMNLKDQLFVDKDSWNSFISDLNKDERLEYYEF